MAKIDLEKLKNLCVENVKRSAQETKEVASYFLPESLATKFFDK